MRVFYRGEVVRCRSASFDDAADLFQLGAELIGGEPAGSDAALFDALAATLAAAGVRAAVTLTDSGIVRALTGSVAEPARGAVAAAIDRKSVRDVESLRESIPAAAFPLLLAAARGELSLERLREFAPARPAAERLAALFERLDDTESVEWRLSCGDAAGGGYYTSLQFEIESLDGRRRFGRGGRYDDLYGRFGFPAAAVGFTLDVDALEVPR
jgi:ATP phosphoribosyltransferase regulatory subunit